MSAQNIYILMGAAVFLIIVVLVIFLKRKEQKPFKFIKPLAWKEVFEIWQNNEINEPHWQEYYKKQGFNSWLDWRKKYIEPIKVMNKNWKLVKVVNPLKSVPNFHGGPYKGWKDYYEGKNLPKFSEMKEHPRACDYLKNLPAKTTIIAWNTETGIIIIEGMHRCAGITKAAKEGKDVKFDLYMAVADCPLSQVPDFRDK